MGPVISALSKAGIAAVAVVLVLARMRSSRQSDMVGFGFARPKLVSACVLLAVYLGWMLLSDALLHWRGPWDFRPWVQAPIAASALRILASTRMTATAAMPAFDNAEMTGLMHHSST